MQASVNRSARVAMGAFVAHLTVALEKESKQDVFGLQSKTDRKHPMVSNGFNLKS
jgi:hypothetical protein